MGNTACKGDATAKQSKRTPEPTPSTVAPTASPKSVGISDFDRCMLQLKLQRDKLSAAGRLYERRAEAERDAAKALLAEGKKEKALYCLKRRKAQEVHLGRVQRYLDNIMTMVQSVEDRQMQNEVATALRQGAEELKALNEHLSLDDIEEIMESAADQIRITDEASALLSQNLVSLDEDDDELLAELDALSGVEAGVGAANSAAGNKTTAKARADADTEAAAAAAAGRVLGEVTVPSGAIEGSAVAVDAEEVAEEEQEESSARVRVAA